jgi:hypothetical protein
MAEQSPIGSFWYSSANTASGTYPYNNVTQTESGHFHMMDDTPGQEKIRTQHRTGTYHEMQPDGSTEHVVQGNGFSVYIKDKNLVVHGVCNIEIYGDSKLHIHGDSYSQVDGSLHSQVTGDANIHVDGSLDVTASGDVDITAGGPMGDITLSAQNSVTINSDLRVSGVISGSAVTADTNVTAGYKCFALGGIETLGGINAGFSTPGPTVAPGIITGLVEVTAPLIQGILVSGITVTDVMGTLGALRLTYDIHTHIAPYGITSSPLQIV